MREMSSIGRASDCWLFRSLAFFDSLQEEGLVQGCELERNCNHYNVDDRADKGSARLVPVKGEIVETRFQFRLLRRPEAPRGTVLINAMLFVLWAALWLCSRLISPSSAVLEVFEVYQPVSSQNHNDTSCNEEILLLNHVFGYSYGQPFVGYYDPPSCEFDTVRINLTVTSKGRQFDRLAHLWLGDIEVFRTSTAEPTADGIIWSYVKDLSQYKVLWQEPQKLIFDLGNLIDDTYTGSFNVTLMARFSHEKNVRLADIVLPISTRSSVLNLSSAFNIPSQRAEVSYRFDSRVSRALVSISACGQSTEEFWWSNVFSSDTRTFDSTVGELYGHSPFREIQLHIDGILAGVVWPFPIIFTGGVSPGFWRPIVGIDAFDLRMPEIDISPFLPLLTDGSYHSIEVRVVGLDISLNGTATFSNEVGSYWAVSGNIFLYLSDGSAEQLPTSAGPGQRPDIVAPTPTFTTTRYLEQNSIGGNSSLKYSVLAERFIAIRSPDFLWSQNLSFSNVGLFNQQGLSQKNVQRTSATILFGPLGVGDDVDELSFDYPLTVNTTYGDLDGGLTIDAWMRRGLRIDSSGVPGISTYTFTSGPLHLDISQCGQSSYQSTADNSNSTSSGDTRTVIRSDAGAIAYRRSVRAVNGTVASDTET